MPQHGHMTVLNVAEKNDAAKEIAKVMSSNQSQRREGFSKFNKIYEFNFNILNNNCKMIMTSVSGHLLDLEFGGTYRNWQGCPPLALFTAPVERFCPDNFQNIKRTLEREARKCQALVIWTDGDREGENIGYEIIEVCKNVKQNLRVYRAKFSEITQTSIYRACRNLVEPDLNTSEAVEVRRELDLRIGAAFTRFQTLRLQKRFPEVLADQLISYGSCQFPTLGFVVERYKQIQDFITETFYKLKVTHTKDGIKVEFAWDRVRLFHERVCQVFHHMCLQNPTAKVLSVTSKPKSKWRPVALDTVELEKSASRKLRINAKETMRIAEKLYTQGFISYPRTETNIFPKELDLPGLVQNQTPDPNWGAFAANILNIGVNPRNGKNTDNAHPPIHPIKYTATLQGNEKRIYEFIVRHFLACLSQDAKGQETTVLISIAEEKFLASGLVILERNYLDVYPYEYWNAKTIPSYCQGFVFQPDSIDMVSGETSPPNLLTEADLIALMEKHGIGTDATHAEHIETIKNRKYVGERNDRYLVPGELGMGLVEGYDSMGFEMSKPNLRSELEYDLKCICDGTKRKEDVLREQIRKYKEVFIKATENVNKLDQALSTYFGQPSEMASENATGQRLEISDPIRKCPKCKNYDMVIRRTKDGSQMVGCQGFPGCKNSIFFPKYVLNAVRKDSVCQYCTPGPVYQIEFEFKRGSVPPMIPLKYLSCIGGCDDDLRELINVRDGPCTSDRRQQPGPSSTHRAPQGNSQHTTRATNSRPPPTPAETRRDSTTTVDRGSRWISHAGPTNLPRSDTDGNAVVCDCGKPAILLTVRKDGPNQGRQFYKCGDDNKCKFFLWADVPTENTDNGNYDRSNRDAGNANSISRPASSLQCNCNMEAVSRTVNKEGPNKGRQFYSCKKPIGQSCGFFQWADEDGNNQTSHQPNRSSRGGAFSNGRGRGRGRGRGNSGTFGQKRRRCGGCGEEGHTKKTCKFNR